MIALLLAISLAAGKPSLPPGCEIPRDHHGKIARSQAAIRDFKLKNVCPANGYKWTGPCQGYHVDHICPLACGGLDHPKNMQWLTAQENLRKGADCSECRRWNLRPECRRR